MKRVLCIFSVLAISVYFAFSQNLDTANIYLGVFVPEQMEDLTPSQLGKINTKIEQICSKSGIASGYTPEGFVIYPKFEIYDDEIVEGGMQNIFSVKTEMTLFIKQYNGALVGSVSKTYKGYGRSRNQAIVSAIQNINPSDITLKKFMSDAKVKIVDYYNTHCEQIKSKASNLSKQQKFEEAIALLMSVPENVACYPSISELIDVNFESYHNQVCAEQLLKAESAMALKNYEECIAALSLIDPTAKCAYQARELLNSIANKISEEEKRDWDFKMQQYNDSQKAETQRIEAIKEIAKAYYNQPKNTTYTQIIK